MRDSRLIQDPVHGLLQFPGMCGIVVDLLRSPELQRLRRIKQLGLAYFVFPGAEHSRLAHSLGASYVATRFGGRLQEEATTLELIPEMRGTAVRDLAVGALCHDLGHGPMSHVWEREVVGEAWDRAAWARALGLPPDDQTHATAKWHELVGYALLRWEDGTLHKMLEAQERGFSARIAGLLAGKYYLYYLPALLSGDVDVDRSDFLLRDSLMTGVDYGRFELDWLVAHLTLGRFGKRWVVGFSRQKALYSVQQFLAARRALYLKVYYHKTVRSLECLAGLFLKRLAMLARRGVFDGEEKFLSENPIVQVAAGRPVPLEKLLHIDDYALWQLVTWFVAMPPSDRTLARLAVRLVERDLLKRVPLSSERISEFFLRRPESWPRILDIVARYCDGDPEYFVSLDIPHFSLLETSDTNCAYLVDIRAVERPARRVRDHSLFRDAESGAPTRLFVPHEAVGEVRQVIQAGG